MAEVLQRSEFNNQFLLIDDLRPEEMDVLNFLTPISSDYPEIERWYLDKVVPGVRAGTRLFVKIERHGQLVGLGIAKNENGEKKVCTLRVAPDYVGRGLGYRIMDDMLRWLDEDQPHVTVGAHKLAQFQRLFDHYGFDMTSQQNGLYVPGRTEIGYNGVQLIDLNGKPLVSTASV